MFDQAGFPDVRIVASNELDEFVIDSIRNEGGRVDTYGVGTNLATASGEEEALWAGSINWSGLMANRGSRSPRTSPRRPCPTTRRCYAW